MLGVILASMLNLVLPDTKIDYSVVGGESIGLT